MRTFFIDGTDVVDVPVLRPVGVGVLAFPVLAGVALATYPTTVLVVGVPVGVVVGFASDGWLAAILNGVLAGVAIGALFFTAGYLLVTSQPRLAPGAGISLMLMALVAVAFVVQSTVSAPLGNVLKR